MKKILIMMVAILTFLMFNNLASANSEHVEYETDENGVVTAITIGEDVTNLMYLLNVEEWKTAETIYFNAINCTEAYYNGYYAFDGYDNIKKVVFGEKVTHIPEFIFRNKSTIEEVVFSSNIETIDSGAFCGTGVKSIIIPSSVKEIGYGAFGNCMYLTDVVFGSNDCVTSEPFAFSGVKQVTFLENVLKIPNKILSDCRRLTTVNMSDNVTDIGENAFYNCTSLIQIDISTACTSIGNDAFNKCSLNELILGDAVKSIGNRAFYGCKFTTLVIPNSVTEIGEQAFTSDYLAEMTLPFIGRKRSPNDYKQKKLAYIAGDITTTIVENIGPVADYILKSNIKKVVITGDAISDYAFYECRYIQQIEAPNAKSIGEKSFYSCSSLSKVTLSNKVAKINKLAFYCCTNITEINIGNSTNIGDWSFYGCTKLNNICGNATYVGEKGFYNCKQLDNIDFLDNVEHIGVDGLYNAAWDNNQDNGLVYIGKVLYRYKGEMPDNTVVEIKTDTISVTDKAFYLYKSLSEIIFPDSIKEIGSRAFQGCNLKTIFSLKD